MERIVNYNHIVIAFGDICSLGIIRSLGESGLKPQVVLLNGRHNCLITNCKYVNRLYLINDESEIVDYLMSNVQSQKQFVYNGSDRFQSVLDNHYEELKDFYFLFNARRNGQVSFYMDKQNINKLAEECGFVVPQSEKLKLGECPTTLKYPVFTKTITPLMEGWKKDVGIFYRKEELLSAYDSFQSKELIVEEYIEKKLDLSIQGISINGGEQIYLPFVYSYLTFSKTSFGGYLEYCYCDNNDLKERISTLIKKVEYSGIFTVDFIKGIDDKLYFLEVNFRLGATNYGCCYGGVNLPVLWAESILSGNINPPMDIATKFYAIEETSEIKYIRQVGIFKWLKQFFGADCYYLWNKRDIKPYFAYWWHKTSKLLHNKI